MATPHPFPPALLICAQLGADLDVLERARAALSEHFGAVAAADEPVPFTWSDYYRREVGESPWRQYLAFRELVDPSGLAGIKLATNRLEAELAQGGPRRVNLDPGYLDLSKLILASAKDATYRVYLGRGISAQPTLHFQDGSYRPWEWTYPSYRDPGTLEFFNRARKLYREFLKG